MTFEYLTTNWKSTPIGVAKAANNIIAMVQVYNEHSGGMVPAWIMVQFLAVNAALQFAGGAATKDADRGSNLPTKYVTPTSDTPRV